VGIASLQAETRENARPFWFSANLILIAVCACQPSNFECLCAENQKGSAQAAPFLDRHYWHAGGAAEMSHSADAAHSKLLEIKSAMCGVALASLCSEG
jgi:hypothetical protein